MEIWGRERNGGFHEELITLVIDKCVRYKSDISFLFCLLLLTFLLQTEHRMADTSIHRAGLLTIHFHYSFFEFVWCRDRRWYEAIDNVCFVLMYFKLEVLKWKLTFSVDCTISGIFGFFFFFLHPSRAPICCLESSIFIDSVLPADADGAPVQARERNCGILSYS